MTGARRAEARVLSATRAQTVAALTATTLTERPVAVHANGTGTFICTLWDDDTVRSFAMVEGVMYPYSPRIVDATSTIPVQILFNVPGA